MVSELSPPVPGLSPTVPGLSRSVPGLSPAVPGLSSAVPGLSPAAPAVSPSVPAVSPPMPRDRAAQPGSARPSPVAAADPVAMLRAVADLATRTITVQDAASVASVLDDVVGELADLLGVAHVGLFQLDEQALAVQTMVRKWCESVLVPRIPAMEAGDEPPFALMRQFVLEQVLARWAPCLQPVDADPEVGEVAGA